MREFRCRSRTFERARQMAVRRRWSEWCRRNDADRSCEGVEDVRGDGGGRCPFFEACRQCIPGSVEKSCKRIGTFHRAEPPYFPVHRPGRISTSTAPVFPTTLVSRRHPYPHRAHSGARIDAGTALAGRLPGSTFDRMSIHQFTQTGIVILGRQHFSIMPNMFRSHSSFGPRTRGFDVDPQGMWRLTRGHVRPIVCLRHGKQALAQRSGHVMPPRLKLERQRGERLRAGPLAGASLNEGDACSSTR